MSVCDMSPIEKLNIKLCKYILGVHKSSTNDAVRGELGRYPLLINILDHAVRYANRTDSLDNHTIVKLSCPDSFWSSCINNIRTSFASFQGIKSNMKEKYKKMWNSFINDCGDGDKLRTYSKYKHVNQDQMAARVPLLVKNEFLKCVTKPYFSVSLISPPYCPKIS